MSYAAKRLTEAQIEEAARSVGLEVAKLKAVIKVESGGTGFWTDVPETEGIVPVINFEGQYFNRLTNGRYAKSHPDLAFNGLDKQFGKTEWLRLRKAIALDRRAALMSASWGLFQIMGANYAACGYPDVEAFVKDMHESELLQLKAALAFMQSGGLIALLKKGDYKGFARRYNGPLYYVNRYDDRIEEAVEEYRKAA